MKLSKEQIGGLITILISTIIAVLAIFGYDVKVAQPRVEAVAESAGVMAGAPTGAARMVADRYFDSLTVGKQLVVTGDLGVVGRFGVGGDSTFNGDLTANGTIHAAGLETGDFTTTGDASFGGTINATKQTTVTVTMNAPITTTKSLVPLTAAGTVATDKLNGCEGAGRVSLLQNVGANSITITDTGKLKLEGNWAAGQYDTLLLIGDGSNCLEVTRGNN